jgi:hypothetical protein
MSRSIFGICRKTFILVSYRNREQYLKQDLFYESSATGFKLLESIGPEESGAKRSYFIFIVSVVKIQIGFIHRPAGMVPKK